MKPLRIALAACVALSPVVARAQAQPASGPNYSDAVTLWGRDSVSGSPCLIGLSATCQIPTPVGSGGGGGIGTIGTPDIVGGSAGTALTQGTGAAGANSLNTSSTAFSPNYQVYGTYGGAGSSVMAGNSAAVGPLYAEKAYILGCAGTAAGNTFQWQALAADGLTWSNIDAAFTSLPNSQSATFSSVAGQTNQPANLRLVETGTGTSTLWCRAG